MAAFDGRIFDHAVFDTPSPFVRVTRGGWNLPVATPEMISWTPAVMGGGSWDRKDTPTETWTPYVTKGSPA
jgi:hypothetical protein